MGKPSNSSSGADNGRLLCGRTIPGEAGKEVPTGDGNEGDCEVDDFDERDVEDFDLEDLVFRGGSFVAENDSERAE